MKPDRDKTYLGIDYGERRIGVAKSDPTGVIASALCTLEPRSKKEAAARIAALIKEHQPAGVVVGYPLLASGARSPKCEAIDRFIALLCKFYDGPIHRVDESHTTEEAARIVHAHGKRVGRNKPRLDRLAAVIILQRFLDEELV